jgi:hypothetical protein
MPQLGGEGAVYTLGVLLHGDNGSLGVQRAVGVLRCAELNWFFLIDICFKNTGEKTRKGAVIVAAYLGPRHEITS